MNRSGKATATVVVVVLLAAFFVPVIPMVGFPVFCRAITSGTCMGGLLPNQPTGSITYWLF